MAAELELRIISQSVEEANKRLDTLEERSKDAEEQAEKLRQEFGRTNREASTLGQQFRTLTQTLGVLGASFALGTTIRSAVGAISDFESTLTLVSNVAVDFNASLEEQSRQMGLLASTARELGASTRFSATEAGEGLLFLARAGFDVDEAVQALPSTLDLAVSGVLSLGEAADIASNVLGQFQLDTGQTTEAIDVLVGASNRANTDVRQLAQALSLAGPFAASLGLDIRETAAALGVLGDAGLQGTRAGTNLRGVLVSLLAPANAVAEEALANIATRAGETTEALDITANSFTDVIRVLNRGAATSTELEAIFGRENVTAGTIFRTFAASVGVLNEELQNVDGEAQRFSTSLSNTLGGALRSVRSAVEALFLSVGDRGLLGALTSAANFTAEVVRALAGFQTEGERASRTAASFAMAVEAGAVALATFTTVRVAGFLATFAQSLLSATGAMIGFNTAVALNPLTTFATLLSAAVGALYLFRDATFSIGDTTVSVSDVVVGAWRTATQQLSFLFRAIPASFRIAADVLSEINETLLGGFATNYLEFFRFLAGNWGTVFGALGDLLKDFANAGIAGVLTLTDTFAQFVSRVALAVDATRNPLRLLRGEYRNEILEALDPGAFVGQLRARYEQLVEKDIVGSLVSGVGDALGDLRDFVVTPFGVTGELAADAFVVRLAAELGESEESVRSSLAGLLRPFEAFNRTLDNARERAAQRTAIPPGAFDVPGPPQLLPAPPVPLPEQVAGPPISPDAERDFFGASAGALALAEASERARDSVDDLFMSLLEERAALQDLAATQEFSGAQREVAIGALELERQARNLSLAEINGLIESYQKEINAQQDATEVDEQRAVAIAKLIELYRELGLDVATLEEDINKSTDNQLQALERLQEGFLGAGGAVSTFVGDLVRGSQDTEAILRNLVGRTLELLLNFALQSIFPSAKGNAFVGGAAIPVQQFQDGGIVDSPVFFNSQNGLSVAGEAGTEGIFPLFRGADNKLGVRAELPQFEQLQQLVSEQRTVRIGQVVIQTRDAESFRRTDRQTAQRVQRIFSTL